MTAGNGLSDAAKAKLISDWERSTWQFRCIEATKGQQTLLGNIILAVLGIAPSTKPRFVCPTAAIDANGFVWTWVQLPKHGPKEADHVPICSVQEMRSSLNKLADYVHMSDKERVEMFDLVRKWIERDERSIQGDSLYGDDGPAARKKS